MRIKANDQARKIEDSDKALVGRMFELEGRLVGLIGLNPVARVTLISQR